MKSKVKHSTVLICISAMYAGLLVGGKAALAAIPNVEIVTLLIALCAYCWGLASLCRRWERLQQLFGIWTQALHV